MTTPEQEFESAQYLVDWAKTELEKLELAVQGFLEPCPATMVAEVNQKTGWHEGKLRIKAPPQEIRGLSNNIIKNLRDALDQVTGAASHLITSKFQSNRHFPFGTSPDDFDNAVRLNQCKHIPPVLYDILKSYEPFPSGDGWDGGNDLFRLLGRVSGSHKHRFTLATTPVIPQAEMSKIDVNGPFTLMDGLDSNGDYVVATVHPDGYLNIDRVAYQVYVGFADPQLEGVPVEVFLRANCATVDHVVHDLRSQALSLSRKPD